MLVLPRNLLVSLVMVPGPLGSLAHPSKAIRLPRTVIRLPRDSDKTTKDSDKATKDTDDALLESAHLSRLECLALEEV